MTLQQLKTEIIEDETLFIIEMYEDNKAEPSEINEAINEMVSEINSYQTPEELMGYYMNRGFDESEAYNALFGYLIEKAD